jgi:MSHA biogenesis protein MshN
MSLINQMLQDLDKRGSDGMQTHAQYAQLGVIATPKSHASWYWMAACLLMFALVAWVFLRNGSSEPVVTENVGSQFASATSVVSLPTSTVTSVAASSASHLEQLAGQANVPTLFQLSTQLSSSTSSMDATQEVKPSTSEVDKKNSEQTKSAVVAAPSAAPNNVVNIASSSITAPVVTKEKAETLKTSPLVKEVTSGQKAEGEYRQATLFYQQSRSADAMASLEQALKLDPKHSAARQLLVSIHLEQRHHEEAMQQLKQGLQHDAEQVELAMMLARLYVEKNKLKEAINVMQKALPRGQDKGEFLAFLATLKQRDAQSAEAVELYRAALRKSPENSSWWMGMGIAFMSLGQSNSALEAFKQAKNFRNLSPELLAFVDQKILFLQQ